MEWLTQKWDGSPHYSGPVDLLGEDGFGRWLWGAEGEMVSRGGVPVFARRESALSLVPRDAWWSLTWWVGHPDVSLYVNINTPSEWSTDRVVSIDLDLDVVVRVDGSVEIVDRDEFEEHRVRYGYPPDVIAATERAAQEAYELAVARVAPFDGVAAEAWIRRALDRTRG